MSILGELLEFVLSILWWFFADILCYATGEILRCLITIGSRKPNWREVSKDPNSEEIVNTLSFWLGLLFWTMIGVLASLPFHDYLLQP